MTNDDKKRYLILKDSNIYKGIIFLAIPLMLNNFLKTFHDIIDMFFVGRIPGRGTDGVASIQLTFPIMFTFLSLGMGLSVAGTALISQLLGSRQEKEATRYASQLLVIAMGLGIILNIVSYFGAPMIIRSMGINPLGSETDRFIFENSVRYLQIRSFELPLLFMFFSFLAVRQASGDTVSPVLVSGSAIILNMILSPVLISVFNMGVPGAALATLISHVLIMPIALYFLFFAKSGVTVRFDQMRLTAPVFNDIIKTAVPASLGQAITAFGFYAMNGMIYAYGTNTIAAFSVGNRITSLILHPVMAIGAVTSAYIGQNIGAQNPERAKLTFRKAMILSTFTMAIGAFFLLLIRTQLAGLFIIDNVEALDLASEYMFYILIGLPLMGIFQTFMGVYNGTGHTKYSFIISVTRLWGMRIPLVLLFGRFTQLGNNGIWYSMLISNFLITIIAYLLYLRIDFKPKIRLEESIIPPLEIKTA